MQLIVKWNKTICKHSSDLADQNNICQGNVTMYDKNDRLLCELNEADQLEFVEVQILHIFDWTFAIWNILELKNC